MRIAVDGYEIGLHSTGVGRVIDNILINLFDLLPEHEFTVFTAEVAPPYNEMRAAQRLLPARGGYFRWQNGPFLRRLKTLDPDILIAPNYTLPLICPWPAVLIEHDISIVARPEWYPWKLKLTRRFLIARSLRRASVVVAPSEFTRREILARYDIDPARIRVIGWGIDKQFRRSSEESLLQWKERKGIAGRKIVGFLGSIFNRRHIPELIEAADSLRRDFPELLVYVVGRDLTHPVQPIREILDKKWIKWETMLPETELPLFYSSLDAFVYLSEYEGFGLPPLEALACGAVPVLLDGSSLKEIFGGMAVMVESPDPRKIGDALSVALSDRKSRESVLARFEARKEDFSWRKTAGEFSLALNELMEKAAAGRGKS